MKLLRLTGILLLFIIGVTVVLSLILPASQTLERTIHIKAPAAVVYEQIATLAQFNEWSVWNQQDSTVEHDITGTDGTVGATSSWKGDPVISGEGKIEITALEKDRGMSHTIHFLSPKKGKAYSDFTLDEKNGMTTVTWHFEMLTPRPWNIFNLVYSIDKEMGGDFDKGLLALKQKVETNEGTPAKETYKIEPMNFPATTFAIVRQKIRFQDLSSFLSTHFPVLYSETAKANATPGTPAALYYEWNEKDQQTDMAAALPVASGTKVDNDIIRIIDIPASKALSVNYHGPYDQLRDAYAAIAAYLTANQLEQKMPAIEQYITGAMQEKDSTKWLTRIVFLVN